MENEKDDKVTKNSENEVKAEVSEEEISKAEVSEANVETEKNAETTSENLHNIDIVAIPYINDGDENVQLFYKSIFTKFGDSDNESAVYSAEKYFFEKFADDDEPKWDGVFICLYDFTDHVIIKDERNVFVEKREFLKNWLWRKKDSMESVTFNVKCTMPKVWASHFQSFLRRMEEFGENGHSGQIAFFSDGAGNFKPKFKFSSEFNRVGGRSKVHITEKADELFDAC